MVTRDSVTGTILVALVLCVVCSVLVAGAAVGLRPRQEANRLLDKQKNVLIAAGLYEASDTPKVIKEKFESVEQVLIDLETCEPVPEGVVDVKSYDPLKASKKHDQSVEIPAGELPGFQRRAKYAFVYEVIEDGQVEEYVFPIYGNGLWSTMYGYLALDADMETINGITFYKDGETPGLGGEINNPSWQKTWHGKKLYDEQGDVKLHVIKGKAGEEQHFDIDGLSGATITSNGVSTTLAYWFGPHGFGPFIDKHRQPAEGGSDG